MAAVDVDGVFFRRRDLSAIAIPHLKLWTKLEKCESLFSLVKNLWMAAVAHSPVVQADVFSVTTPAPLVICLENRALELFAGSPGQWDIQISL